MTKLRRANLKAQMQKSLVRRGHHATDDVSGELTDRQAAFCYHWVKTGGDEKSSIVLAGYTAKNSTTVSGQVDALLATPKIIRQIRQHQVEMLQGRLGNLALGTIQEILLDKDCAPKVRLDAAKFALEKAGIDKAQFEVAQDLDQMTLGELKGMLQTTHDAIGELTPMISDVASRETIDGDGHAIFEDDEADALMVEKLQDND